MVCGGGQITARPHVLSRDGKHLLVCVGPAVRVHSAVTSELLQTLSAHTDEVTSLALHPSDPAQAYSASLDGSIILWDLPSGAPLKTWAVGEPIESMVLPACNGGSVAFLSTHWGGRGAGRVAAYDLHEGKMGGERAKTSSPRQLVVSGSGRHIALVERHSLLVWPTERFSKRPLALHHTRPLTCAAISPDDAQIAAGDASGRIVVWHNLAATAAAAAAVAGGAAKASASEEGAGEGAAGAEPAAAAPAPAATVHWHAHAVGCLAFSVDGSYLLSGGLEAVLVAWDFTSGRRAYLPRLGGPLTGLAVCPDDPAKYALRQADNTIRVVNMASMRVECSLHGLRPPPAQPPSLLAAGLAPPSAALALQPGTGNLVVAGPHAMLQFYDALRDAHVDRLQVSPRNLTSLTEADAAQFGGAYGPPVEPAATCVAFSRDASIMATVEVRPDVGGAGSALYSLKFWERQGAGAQYGQPYVLNTLADQPHRSSTGGSGAVASLAYHPSDHLVCTTSSSSADFRVWARQAVPGRAGAAAGHTWRCRAVGSYRGEPMHACAFSSDGSILAVAAGSTVTLWDAYRTALLATLPSPLPAGLAVAPVVHLAFLKDSPYLVAGSGSHLTVYNLLTQAAEWCHPLPVADLAADPGSQHFAVVLPPGAGGQQAQQHSEQAQQPQRQQGSVLVFCGGGRTPVGGWALRRPAAARAVFALPRTPLHSGAAQVSLPGMSPLLVISHDRQYAQAGQPGAAAAPAASAAGAAAAPDRFRRMDSFVPRGAGTGAGTPDAVLPGQTPQPVSGLEAMYGSQALQQAQQAGAKPAAPAVTAGEAGTAPWAGLFDAPSHVLPPLSALCPAFLELVLSREGVRADTDMEQ